MKGKSKTQKGITLVALIITIVVLLILAMVSINAIQNDGIMSKAQNVADQFNEKQAEEENTLGDLEGWLDKYGAGSGNTYTAYSIGDEVTIGTESFYVIKDSGTSEANVVLLAKLAIDTTNLVQSASANSIAFSETNYWADTATSYPYDLTETGEPDSSHYAAYAAYQYGKKLGGTGRLMYGVEISDLYGNSETDYIIIEYGGEFWVGTAGDTDSVENFNGETGGYFNYKEYEYGHLRPVVTISKSKLS